MSAARSIELCVLGSCLSDDLHANVNSSRAKWPPAALRATPGGYLCYFPSVFAPTVKRFVSIATHSRMAMNEPKRFSNTALIIQMSCCSLVKIGEPDRPTRLVGDLSRRFRAYYSWNIAPVMFPELQPDEREFNRLHAWPCLPRRAWTAAVAWRTACSPIVAEQPSRPLAMSESRHQTNNTKRCRSRGPSTPVTQSQELAVESLDYLIRAQQQ